MLLPLTAALPIDAAPAAAAAPVAPRPMVRQFQICEAGDEDEDMDEDEDKGSESKQPGDDAATDDAMARVPQNTRQSHKH